MTISDSLPSTGETARSEDVAVPRADLCIVAALAWEGHPSHTSIEAIRRIEAALAAAPRPDGTVEEALRLIVKSAVDYAGLSAPDTKLDFIIASIVEKLRWHQKALEFFRPTPTGDVAAKLAEIGQALQTWREPFGNYEQTFHSYCKFLLPLTERAAALEQENERLTAIMRDATDTIQQFVRTNNEGNGASSGAFIARSRTNPPRSGRRPMSDPYEEYIDPQCAAEIHRLQAELSAARAEAEQAREKAIEEAAVICTNEAE